MLLLLFDWAFVGDISHFAVSDCLMPTVSMTTTTPIDALQHCKVVAAAANGFGHRLEQVCLKRLDATLSDAAGGSFVVGYFGSGLGSYYCAAEYHGDDDVGPLLVELKKMAHLTSSMMSLVLYL